MKKIGMLVFIIMMMAVVTAVQAEVRAGGLPAVVVDDRIGECAGPCPPPPVVEQKVEAPAPVKEKVTISLNVQFDSDKAVVKEKYHDDIKRVADFMKEFPDTTAEIGGHTDSTASNAHNQKLSEKRANSVRQYIIDKFGIDGSRLTAKGYGEDRPIASNNTEEGKQKNRRVEAVIETVHTIK
jgi:OOP family OmpA-OmpF porin